MDPTGEFVLYWMTSARRLRSNFGLQRAVALSQELGKPLLILEALRLDYPFASDRLHSFVIDGMRANARLAAAFATYYPYVERAAGEARGLLAALAARAAVIVTDWYPAFFLPAMLRSAAAKVSVRLESVDTNGLIPVAEHGRAFPTARGYRAFVQRTLRTHLKDFPQEQPLEHLDTARATIPPQIMSRWPAIDISTSTPQIVADLPIDHSVAAVATAGGSEAAAETLHRFLTNKLARYVEDGNDPDADATSRLSPYLHFGHISAHEVFAAVMTHEKWTTRKLRHVRAGSRAGWWGTSPAAEHFVEQLVVWRELAFNGCAWTPGFTSYTTLPAWARATLEAHVSDPRPQVYPLEALDAATTHDPVWNAAQNQLRTEGWFHGYMRMVWGKKILEWCRDPADALGRMEALMNRYSLDGRDPVSYLNFGWVLGRYDRPWFERPIFGTVRYMTSESARRKLDMENYLRRYGGAG